MGKTVESAAKRARNNGRVDPASIKSFMCYYCGKMSNDKLEYQIHMLKVHEVMSQSYQLWSDDKMDTLNLRWSETKSHDDQDTSCSHSPSSPSSRHEAWQQPGDEDDEDYVYEQDKAAKKRKKEEEKARKAAAEKQRRFFEEQKRWSELATERAEKEEMRREKARRDEERRQKEDEAREYSEEPKEKKKKRKLECSRWKEIQSEGTDKPEVTALVKKIMEESKRKEASSQEVEEAVVTPELFERRCFDHGENAMKHCKICKKGQHYSFAALFEHYQDHHHAVLKSIHYYGYNGKKLVGRKNLIERDYCQRCSLKFPRARQYFSHMIHNHIQESVKCLLDFESANNADVEVQMTFRDRIITLGYNFPFDGEAPEDVKPVIQRLLVQQPSTSAVKVPVVPRRSDQQPGTSAVKLEEPEHTEPSEQLIAEIKAEKF